MSSTSEKSYGSRIGNAEKMLSALQSFNSYHAPHPELEIAVLDDRIKEIKALNRRVASTKQNNSLAIAARKGLYVSDELSISKALLAINGNVMATFGRKSKESIDIYTIVKKTRGTNKKTPKNPDEDSISQSYQSFNSIIQFFSDVVVHLTRFEMDGNYNPSDARLDLASLNAQYEAAVAANNLVVSTFSSFKQTNATRIEKYAFLSTLALRIKDSVVAQYGKNSPEYAVVKKLFI